MWLMGAQFECAANGELKLNITLINQINIQHFKMVHFQSLGHFQINYIILYNMALCFFFHFATTKQSFYAIH